MIYYLGTNNMFFFYLKTVYNLYTQQLVITISKSDMYTYNKVLED